MERSTHQERFCSTFQEWISQQGSDLPELLQAAATATATSTSSLLDDAELRSLVAKNLQRYQAYAEKRSALVREDAFSFFCPTWCDSFENSCLWIGGCRPTLIIRLVYDLTGEDQEAHLDDFLRGVRRGDLGELSAQQLGQVDGLHRRILREEDRLTAQLASLQEGMADKPMTWMARNRAAVSQVDVAAAVDSCAGQLASVVEAADRLRVETLREVVGILTSLQAVEFLAAAKQLHLSVHEWSRSRNGAGGRGQIN